jgi:hypothetical protein
MADVKAALALFAGCSSSFGSLFFGQAYLVPDEVAGALRFSRDVPEDLARAFLELVHSFSEIALRTFWAAATGRVNLDARISPIAVMLQQGAEAGASPGLGVGPATAASSAIGPSPAAGSTRAAAGFGISNSSRVGAQAAEESGDGEGSVHFVPNARMLLLPRLVDKGGVGLKVLLKQRLLQALNLGDYAHSTEAQEQARLTARDLQQIKEGLRGDVREGKLTGGGWGTVIAFHLIPFTR